MDHQWKGGAAAPFPYQIGNDKLWWLCHAMEANVTRVAGAPYVRNPILTFLADFGDRAVDNLVAGRPAIDVHGDTRGKPLNRQWRIWRPALTGNDVVRFNEMAQGRQALRCCDCRTADGLPCNHPAISLNNNNAAPPLVAVLRHCVYYYDIARLAALTVRFGEVIAIYWRFPDMVGVLAGDELSYTNDGMVRTYGAGTWQHPDIDWFCTSSVTLPNGGPATLVVSERQVVGNLYIAKVALSLVPLPAGLVAVPRPPDATYTVANLRLPDGITQLCAGPGHVQTFLASTVELHDGNWVVIDVNRQWRVSSALLSAARSYFAFRTRNASSLAAGYSHVRTVASRLQLPDDMLRDQTLYACLLAFSGDELDVLAAATVRHGPGINLLAQAREHAARLYPWDAGPWTRWWIYYWPRIRNGVVLIIAWTLLRIGLRRFIRLRIRGTNVVALLLRSVAQWVATGDRLSSPEFAWLLYVADHYSGTATSGTFDLTLIFRAVGNLFTSFWRWVRRFFGTRPLRFHQPVLDLCAAETAYPAPPLDPNCQLQVLHQDCEPKLAYVPLVTMAVNQEPSATVFRKCTHNLERAVALRTGLEKLPAPAAQGFAEYALRLIQPVEIKWMSNAEWLKRWPEYRRGGLDEARHSRKIIHKSEVFVKRELLPQGAHKTMVTKAKPRQIVKRDDTLLVALGPPLLSIAKALATSWGLDRDQPPWLLYAYGAANATTMGTWLERTSAYIGTFGELMVVEIDCANFDGHVTNAMLEQEIEIYRRLGLKRQLVNVMRRDIRTHATSTDRFSLRVRTETPGRHSGDVNTSLGNTLQNGPATVRSAEQLGVPWHHMAIIVLGDDQYMVTLRKYEHALRQLPELFLAYGHEVKVAFHPMWGGTFCSGVWGWSQEGPVWTPVTGRLLSKTFNGKTLDASVNTAMIRGTALGLRQDVNHVPLLRKVCSRVLEETAGINPPVLVERRFHTAFHHNPTSLHPSWYLNRYGLTAEEHARCLLDLDSGFPWVLRGHHWAKIFSVDIPEADAMYETWTMGPLSALGACRSGPVSWRLFVDVLVTPVIEEIIKRRGYTAHLVLYEVRRVVAGPNTIGRAIRIAAAHVFLGRLPLWMGILAHGAWNALVTLVPS